MIVVMLIGLLSMIAVPSFIRSRESTRASLCMSHQRLIEGALDRWAIDSGAPPGSVARRIDLQPHIGRGEWPVCPFGNTPFPTELLMDTPVGCPSGAPTHVR
jgi:type II secretory pathway pseudopilin PulG